MRRYLLNSHEDYGFQTGRASDNRQAIVGTDGDICLAVVFQADGAMLTVLEYDRGSTWDEADQAMRALKDEIQFVEGPIEILAFNLFDRDRFIGIEEMPAEYQEFLADPSSVSESSALELQSLIGAWQKRGNFVVWWNEDFWCGPDGHIQTH